MLNNVQIKGAVYNTYGEATRDPYNCPVVLSSGISTIANSCISNCAAPVTYTYIDEQNYDYGGEKTAPVTYVQNLTLRVVAVKPDAKHAEIIYTGGQATRTATLDGKTYAMPDVTETSPTIGSTTVSGTTVYFPIVPVTYLFNSSDYTCYSPAFTAVNIKDYTENGDAVNYNVNTATLPTGFGFEQGRDWTTTPYLSGSGAGKEGIRVYTPEGSATLGLCYYSIKAAKNNANIPESKQLVCFYYRDNVGDMVYYYVQYKFPQDTFKSSCIAEGTLITLADGSQKKVEDINKYDMLKTYDFYGGSLRANPVVAIEKKTDETCAEIVIQLDNGSSITAIAYQSFFDMDAREYFVVDNLNYTEHIGKRIMVLDGDTIGSASITDIKVSEKVLNTYELITAYDFNFFGNNILTCEPFIFCTNIFEIGEDYKIDAEQMRLDIETYGLYSYEEFKDYLSEEEFNAFNGAYFKVAVGKGLITYEYILEALEIYMNQYIHE